MYFRKKIFPILLFFSIIVCSVFAFSRSNKNFELLNRVEQQSPDDTVKKGTVQKEPLKSPINPLQQNTYEDIEKKYPLDAPTPDNVKTVVEYDPVTGNYIMRTKVGDTEIATPFVLTEQQYRDYSERQTMADYWKLKNTADTTDNERKFSLSDMKFEIPSIDKVFGPGGLQVKTQGSAELLFGIKNNKINNPTLPQRQRNVTSFDFDEKIQMNVTGKVGNKINFGINYNTESTFDFDRQIINLNYRPPTLGEGEDDIIRSLEAGNVSMQLNSSLISGSTALFGIKTELQFGKLNVTALVSQQQSQSQSVNSQGGVQTTDYEINIDNYDENRHFFLSQYFRDNYEKNLANLPLITSGIIIDHLEVWITNKRANYDQSRNIVAFMDLAESNDANIDKYLVWNSTGNYNVPDNHANTLYDAVRELGIRDIQQTNSIMESSYGVVGVKGGEDYEKIESARLLTTSEYDWNPNLGYISLRQQLRPDDVLAVAYTYTQGGSTFRVGELSANIVDPAADATGQVTSNTPGALIVKLLKGTTQSPQLKSWKLMMKNVYSLGAMQMQQENFKLNVVYRNDSVGTDLQYLNEGNVKGKLLLRVMNLDRLNYRNDPVPDGKFDYVEGATVQSNYGRIIFPVLEPFGSHLRKMIGNDAIADKYVYQELYDSTLVMAQEFSEKNKFRLVGEYQAASGSEIRLNAMNVPRGSVVVTAGGQPLVENVDYTVDYIMGTVTILNQSLIGSATNIEVKLENQNMFSMQRKTLLGTHLEYQFSKDFTLGGTLMHLSEQPLTKKVNVGNEPMKNTIWGMNTSWRHESQWLTDMLDKLPFVNATQPSTLALNAEFAQLIPGHSKAVGTGGYAYIDDFESSTTNIDIHYPYYWHLASTPGEFAESKLSNNINYGKNRAHLAWFYVDNVLNGSSSQTPNHLKDDVASKSNHFTRRVRINEVFPNRETSVAEAQLLTPLNLSYYPKERGMYNVVADEINADGTLKDPENRWGGIMRSIDQTDFEASNIEYIEFWMLDPFIGNTNPNAGGELVFNLGDISEDILKDGKKFFENGLNIQGDNSQNDSTVWGYVPRTQSTVNAFDNSAGARARQDVGLNGMTTEQERTFPTYSNYVANLLTTIDGTTRAKWETDPFSPINDPAGDNYHFYRGGDYDDQKLSILDRYKYYNGTEGNSPDATDLNSTYSTSASSLPDVEDINNDNTLNEYEKYFEYRIQIDPNKMNTAANNYVADQMTTAVTLENGRTESVTWYQFRIPIKDLDKAKSVGNMKGFRSIRFLRMYLTGFTENTFLRFATMDLVRGDWRTYSKKLTNTPEVASNAQLNVQSVNIEENADKVPVNYVLPPGITRQTDPGQPQLIQQNEQALLLNVQNLQSGEAKAVYKNLNLDMRQYKRLQMFVHAESFIENTTNLQDNQLRAFIRLGSDMTNNYYEYEIPLVLTPAGNYSNMNENDRAKVWPRENMFDFPFSALTAAKLARNRELQNGGQIHSIMERYNMSSPENPNHLIWVVGNPTISKVENVMIGVRNSGSDTEKSGEIWVNELRMSEFDEDGGWAAMANLALNLSDVATLNLAGRTETAGFGGIESNVLTRRLDDMYQYNISTQVNVGRFLPEKAKVELPVFFSYSNETLSPKYNPLDEDILLTDAVENLDSKRQQDSLLAVSQTISTQKSFNIANAKLNIRSKTPQFYDPANFTFGYMQNETNHQTPEIERDYVKTQEASIAYTYSFNVSPLKPFFKSKSKVINSPFMRLVKDLNFNYLPNSIAFQTNMNRHFTQTVLRQFEFGASGGSLNEEPAFSSEFMWSRQFDIRWNPFQALQLGLTTAMNSNIEESYYTPEINRDYYDRWRDTVWQSIRKLGTPYAYQQVFTASYNVPIAKLPFLDFINQTTLSYNATYNWDRGAELAMEDVRLGNIVTSKRDIQAVAGANLEMLYNKVPYLAAVNKRYAAQPARQGLQRQPQKQEEPKKFTSTVKFERGKSITINHKLNNKVVKVIAVNKTGKAVKFKTGASTNNDISITPQGNADSVMISVIVQNPDADRSLGRKTADFLARTVMMVRTVNGTYRTSNSLTLPGFAPQAGFMGQRQVDGIFAPGWDFAFGLHNDNTVQNALQRGWLTTDSTSLTPAIYAQTTDLQLSALIEPFADLKINLEAKRQTAQNTTVRFMDNGMPQTFTGTYQMTILSMKTAFAKIGTAKNNYNSEPFNDFLKYRTTIKNRLQSNYNSNIRYPNQGFINQMGLGDVQYDETLGKFTETSADVLIPAFLAAYTGKNPNKVETSPFLSLLSMFPNWRATYNGLSRIPFVKKHFTSVSLTHGYTSIYNVGSYSSFSDWIGINGDNSAFGYIQNVTDQNPLPSSPYNISAVTITESFLPLIGVNAVLKNSMTAKVEYKTQRTVALNLSSLQLIETASNELVIGMGYTLKDFDLILQLKNDKQSKIKNDLRLNVDLSYKDVKSLLRKLSENITQPSNGNKIFAIKVLADYVFSSKVNIQLFYDRQMTTPLISTAYPVAASNFGINFKFMLTR
ncbi:MAG: cell surface protein SprA [Prevotellaceae bacterium]|jgi:cell surface protein SprA|nr:cell surface protein SprA [Prevotellaceae bacterium]